MELFETLTTAPISTLLVIGGMLFLLLSFVTLRRPIVVELNSTSRTTAGIVGGFLVLLGVGLSALSSQPVNAGMTPTAAVTPSVPPTAVRKATATPSPAPVSVRVSETPTVVESSGLFSRNCFDSTLWLLSPGGGAPPFEKNGCWPLAAWGWSASDDGLSIYIHQSPNTDTYGIYTSIQPNAAIAFDLEIDRMYSLGNSAARVFFGILDADDMESGSFFMLKEMTDVTRAELQAGNNMKYPSHLDSYFRYGRPNRVELVLDGTKLSIYLNHQLLSEQSVTVPEPYFWIGNRFNAGGDVELTISNFTIYEE